VKRKASGGNVVGTAKRSQTKSANHSAIVDLGIPALLFGQGLALVPFSFRACIAFMSFAVIFSWSVNFELFLENDGKEDLQE
jgi:hypothetical protein